MELTADATVGQTRSVYLRPDALSDTHTHYCPGCGHGIVHRILAEVIDELDIRERSVLVAPVGCAVFAYKYFTVDGCEAAHGRAPAMATGIKRVLPSNVVITYQGDGDLASIGAAEILHVAARGEKITTIFVNNAIYGMTGGQMAPTSLVGQKTTSSPLGRNENLTGAPLQMSEILATIPGAAYIVRRSIHDPASIRKTKKAIATALRAQMAGIGFSMVEVLSTCPTNWGLSATDAMTWVKEKMVPVFPLGDFKVSAAVREL
jgi:2-oxoglutarate/2-oxoacid ferredoxin oxidoreductase subunit beta